LKKPIIYLFITLFLSGGLLEKELSKVDGYWRHYQYHLSRNPNYTVSHFIYVHFLDGIHTKFVSKRHRSLPFKKRDTSSTNIVFCNKLPQKNIVLEIILKENNFPPLNNYLIPEFENSLLKPPCA